mgnify:CR=1 FL=1
MQKYSDSELVALYLEAKDLKYLTELFTRHSDIVYRTALRTMKNASDAEDIMQVAYIKMISHMHLFKGTGSVLGWMLQMVVYSCYDQLRSEKSRLNREKKIMSERTPMTTPKNDELKEMMDKHLSMLPEIYRAPITLQILEGLTIKEVSEVLQIPEKTIRSQIARGLEKLKVSLQNVGVTASVISLGDMLKEIHQPLAPEIYKSSQYFNSLYQQKAMASAKLAVTASGKGFVVQKVLAIALLVVASVSGLVVWNHLANKSKINSAPKIFKKWDFENTKDLSEYQDIGLLNGAIAIDKSMGENLSNGLMVDEKSIFELDISKYKMPLKITYKTNYFFPKEGSLFGQMVIKSNYLKDQKVFFFSGIREKIKAETKSINGKIELNGNWYQNVTYVDEKGIDFWVEGQRSQVLLGQSSLNSKIFLSIYGKAVIDNLIIETIEEKDLPDKSQFETVAKTMEIKEGIRIYSIEKEKLGISNISTANPQLDLMTAEDFEKNVGANLKGFYPSLNKENNVVWVMTSQKLIQQWDFENSKDLSEYLGIRLVNGGISIEDEIGVNNSKALLTTKNTLIEFDISKYKLPIKISLDVDAFVEGQFFEPIFVKNNYLNELNTLLTNGSVKTLKFEPSNKKGNAKLGYHGEWLKIEAFIDETAIDFWLDGFRGHIMYGVSRDNNKVYLSINKVIIDNLKIESIKKENLPDKSAYVAFIESFAFKKDIENYSIEKEKLGLDKNNSEVNPYLFVKKPEYFVNYLGVNNEVNHPYLSESKKVEWVKSRQKLVKKWEFESFKELYDFKLIRGLFGYGEGKGINNSNGVSVNMETVLEIDISKYKLPLRITFSFDCLVSKGMTSNGFVIAKSKYQENKNVFFFTQLSPAPILDSLNEKIINENSKMGYYGIWLPAVIYVSEDAIDQWLYDKRAGLTLGSSIDNQKLYINFKDKTFFDNFTIESIEPSVVPDVSLFKSFSATLPYYNTPKDYYKLDKEKQILKIVEDCPAQLGICNSVTLEKTLGIDKKLEVIPFGGNNKKP